MLRHRLTPYVVALSLPLYISYMGNKSNLTSYRPYGQGSTFMYIFHFMSIDLQSSRSFNSPTLHCYIKSMAIALYRERDELIKREGGL
jgi:hypothetical protein